MTNQRRSQLESRLWAYVLARAVERTVICNSCDAMIIYITSTRNDARHRRQHKLLRSYLQ